MEHPGFAYLWQQQELSDVLIRLYAKSAVHSAADGAPDGHNSTHTLLQQFPGHSAILGLSEYFKAQASLQRSPKWLTWYITCFVSCIAAQ